MGYYFEPHFLRLQALHRLFGSRDEKACNSVKDILKETWCFDEDSDELPVFSALGEIIAGKVSGRLHNAGYYYAYCGCVMHVRLPVKLSDGMDCVKGYNSAGVFPGNGYAITLPDYDPFDMISTGFVTNAELLAERQRVASISDEFEEDLDYQKAVMVAWINAARRRKCDLVVTWH